MDHGAAELFRSKSVTVQGCALMVDGYIQLNQIWISEFCYFFLFGSGDTRVDKIDILCK